MPSRPALPSLRGRVGVCLAVLLAALAGTALLLGPPGLPWAEAGPTARPPSADTAGQRSRGVVLPASRGTGQPARGLLADHDAATRDPRGLMQELSGLRAHAMNTGSSSDLAALDAPASPALAQDVAVLERMRRSGLAYTGVGLQVRSATVMTVTGDRARVRAVVDTAAYHVVSGSATTQAQPARPGEPMVFGLRWSGARWQVERVEAA